MNTLYQNEKLPFRKILCSLFGHKLIIKRNVTSHFREYECSVCRLELTNNDKGEKMSLTPHLKEVNETLYNFYIKKHHIA